MHSATKFLAGIYQSISMLIFEGHSDVLCGILVCAEERDGFQLIYERTNSGAVMGNLENFLLLRSLRTLDLRVTRQSQSSIKVAKFLSKAPEVEIVWHPSLPSHPGYKLCKEQMKGPPPILSLQLKAELVTPFLSHLKLVKNATSLGGTLPDPESRLKPAQEFTQQLIGAILMITRYTQDYFASALG